MKYQIVRTRRFKTAFKRVQKLPGFKLEVFRAVVSALADGGTLDKKYKDHKLTGNLKRFRECHIAPDILLIYELDEGVLTLTLVTIGSHSSLFK